jgi:hypothetical protein
MFRTAVAWDMMVQSPSGRGKCLLLKEIRKEEGLTSEWVFTYARRTIDRLDSGFSGTS